MVESTDPAPRAHSSADADVQVSAKPPVTLEASALFAGGDEVRLMHRGQEYRLRITRQGKLILTK